MTRLLHFVKTKVKRKYSKNCSRAVCTRECRVCMFLLSFFLYFVARVSCYEPVLLAKARTVVSEPMLCLIHPVAAFFFELRSNEVGVSRELGINAVAKRHGTAFRRHTCSLKPACCTNISSDTSAMGGVCVCLTTSRLNVQYVAESQNYGFSVFREHVLLSLET